MKAAALRSFAPQAEPRSDPAQRAAVAESGGERLFFATLAAFCAIYLVWYPATYSISDESAILSLSYALARGTVYLDRVGLTAGLQIKGHIVSLYSPFHAALLVPGLVINWRIDFALTAMFFIIGAFVLRGMLKREGLSSGWCLLYFLNPGALYYSQTLMAAVPAAALGLTGVSMLMRPAPKAVLGGLALGAAVLVHPWMAAVALGFASIWICEGGGEAIVGRACGLAIGAAPAVAMLATYNFLITGSPLKPAYWVLGHQHDFQGIHFWSFATFYLGSLAIFPLAGWSVLGPRWAKGWALPAASAITILLASAYYYRDGLNLQSHSLMHLMASAIPGQRFLLPVSFIACLPAARWLDAHIPESIARFRTLAAASGLGAFVILFVGLSLVHQDYLRAHAQLQRELNAVIPVGAEVVAISDSAMTVDTCKEFAPIYKIVHCIEHDSDLTEQMPYGAYLVWAGVPGSRPSPELFRVREQTVLRARSRVWNVDVWLVAPDDLSGSPAR